ncbi:hypothetical protein HPB48_011087 [Haemaphysalis longicornis]|uniref:DDE-1 domain-containing protein n=1 Tax=Haemaphysalis longicornis TaxID=44386 RepID=A0A9J6GRA3_HAELO|nr:hypothetical protein HPB48_011087 [Haemaphysalis longicornis]
MAHHIEGLQLLKIEVHYFPANCTALTQRLDQGVTNSFKHCYQHQLIEKILLNIHLGQQTKIDIYQVLMMLAAFQKEIGVQVTMNCFMKAGVTKNSEAGADDKDDEPSPSDVAEMWSALFNKGCVLDNVDLSEFLFADSAAVAMKEMSDAALAERVQDHNGGGDGPSEADPNNVPTAKKLEGKAARARKAPPRTATCLSLEEAARQSRPAVSCS